MKTLLPYRMGRKHIFPSVSRSQIEDSFYRTTRIMFYSRILPSNLFIPQVLALARSRALRGRPRVSPGTLPQPSPATLNAAATANTAAPKRRKAKAKPRDGKANPRKHGPSGEKLVFTFPHFHDRLLQSDYCARPTLARWVHSRRQDLI